MSSRIVSLEDISISLRNGKSIKQSPNAGGLPITRIETIARGQINMDKCGYADLKESENKEWLLEYGDILISHINSIDHLGKCAIFESKETKLIHGMNLLNLKIDQSKAFPKYIFYVLKSARFLSQITKITKKSVNQASFNISSFQKLLIPLPPLDEQQRIIKILDLCSSINQSIEICSSKSSNLNSALLIDRFGDLNPKKYKDNLVNLEDVLKKITYGLTVRPKYFEEGVPLIAASQIRNGYIDYISAPKISSEDFDKLSDKCKPKKGDILFSKTGSIGHSAIVGETRNFAIAQNVARLTFDKEKVNSNWMLNVLRSDYIQKLSIIKSKGNAVKDLQLGEIKNFKIFLPPLNKQNEYSYLITYIDKLNKKLKERKEILTKLISSIESFAFRVSY